MPKKILRISLRASLSVLLLASVSAAAEAPFYEGKTTKNPGLIRNRRRHRHGRQARVALH